MLPRIHRLSCARTSWPRKYTTSTEISTDTSPSTLFTQTFKKVTAYPFCTDPWHAQAMMDMTAALIKSKHLGIRPKLSLYKYWQSEQAGQLPYLYSLYLKSRSKSSPLRAKALYFPAWKIWSALELVAMRPDMKFRQLTFSMENKHMPGSHTPPLLAKGMSELYTPDYKLFETLPLSECLSPYGLDVECLPFTISPFALIDMAKSVPNPESNFLCEGAIIMTESLDFDLFSAFPVLYPLYTSEYTCPATKRIPEWKFQLFAFAHDKAPRLATVYPMIPLAKIGTDKRGQIDIMSYPMYKLVDHLLSVPALRTDDDASIRPMKPEELEPILRYMKLKLAHNKAMTIDTSTWPKSTIDEYRLEVNEMGKRAQECVPSWWNQSRLARQQSSEKQQPEKGKPLRSRSSPITNLKVNPTRPPASPPPKKKSKRKSS